VCPVTPHFLNKSFCRGRGTVEKIRGQANYCIWKGKRGRAEKDRREEEKKKPPVICDNRRYVQSVDGRF